MEVEVEVEMEMGERKSKERDAIAMIKTMTDSMYPRRPVDGMVGFVPRQ